MTLKDKPCYLVAKRIVLTAQEINGKSVTLMITVENLKEIKTTPEVEAAAEVKTQPVAPPRKKVIAEEADFKTEITKPEGQQKPEGQEKTQPAVQTRRKIMPEEADVKTEVTKPEVQEEMKAEVTAGVQTPKGNDVSQSERMPEVELTPEERRHIEGRPNMTRITPTSVSTGNYSITFNILRTNSKFI